MAILAPRGTSGDGTAGRSPIPATAAALDPAAARGADRGWRQRLYIVDLDSPAQAAAVPGGADTWSAASVSRDLVGVMRAAILVGGSMTVSDTQFLDGRVFMALGPDGFANLVGEGRYGRQWPLEVCSRAANLADSLVAILTPHGFDDAHLSAHYFSIIEPVELRSAVATNLALIPTADLFAQLTDHDGRPVTAPERKVGAVVAMLRRAGLTGEHAAQADAIERRWISWLEAAERFRVVPYPHPLVSLGGEPDPRGLVQVHDALDAIAAPQLCRDTVARIADPKGGIRARSHAYKEVLDPLDTHPDATTRQASVVIRQWVDDWYFQSVAASMDAEIFDARSAGDGSPRRWNVHFWLTIDSGLRRDFGAMPTGVYTQLRYRSRQDDRSWWGSSTRERRAMHRRIAIAIRDISEQADARRHLRDGLSKIAILIAAALLAAVSFDGFVKWIVVVVAAVFATGPELYETAQFRGRALDRYFSVAAATTKRRATRSAHQ